MASKEYYDIAYGLRDLAKELNRSDVINTIDSEIKKMKFDELGKNVNYSYLSKTNKNKEENKDKYKPSKKKTILATENLANEDIEDVWYDDDWTIEDEDVDLEEDFISSNLLNEGVSSDDKYLSMDYDEAMDSNWKHYIFSVETKDGNLHDERGSYSDDNSFNNAIAEIKRRYGNDLYSINAIHDKGTLKYYTDLYNRYLKNKNNNQQSLKNNNNPANSNISQNSNSTQNSQQQNNFQQAAKRKNNPIYKQRTKNNSKIVQAFKNNGLPTDKLTQQVTDKNGRVYTKATPVLKKLRKDLYGESLGEDLEETSPYTNIKSNGIYSLNTGWVKHPVQQDIPDIDMEEFEKEFKVWEDKYFDLLDELEESISDNQSKLEKIDNLIEDIYNLRKEGMEEDGEYSIKNLIFKEFRNLGYLDNLKELRKKEISKELSLEQLNEVVDKDLMNKISEYFPLLDDIKSGMIIGLLNEVEDNLDDWMFPDLPSYTSLKNISYNFVGLSYKQAVENLIPFLLLSNRYDVFYTEGLYGWDGDSDYIITRKGCSYSALYKMLSAGFIDNGDEAPTKKEFLQDVKKVSFNWDDGLRYASLTL